MYDNDYKHPVVLAKELATMDVLSDGRVEIGLGAGWMVSDYEQSGITYDPPGVRVEPLRRGARGDQGRARAATRSRSRASTTRSPTTTACPSRSSTALRC